MLYFMVLQVPYNVERMMFLYSNKDTARVRQLMEEFERSSKVCIPRDILENMKTAVTGEGDYSLINYLTLLTYFLSFLPVYSQFTPMGPLLGLV